MAHLATEFKLWDMNPDPGAWLTYGTRYTQNQLLLKRQQLVDVIDGFVTFEDKGEEVSAQMSDGNKLSQRAIVLLEELACVNEALDFHMNRSEFAGKGLTYLLDRDLRGEIDRDSVGGTRKVDLYNDIDIGWGLILGDIIKAHNQNNILTSKQQRLLENLARSRIRAVELLQGRHIILQA